jgi:hypothetical protein
MKRSVAQLTCKDVVELISDYLGRRLQPDESGPLEQHLLLCEPCTAYLEQMRSIVELAGTLDRAVPPSPDRSLALDVFRRWKRGGA